MRRLSFILLVVTGSVVSNAAILTNGGFELPGTPVWAHFQNGELPGWHTGASDVMEVGVGVVYGVTGFEGKDVLELDSTKNILLSQTVSLSAGQYDLSFLYAKRGTNLGGRPADTCNFDVLWNNAVIASFAPGVSAMTLSHKTVAASNGSNTLSFRGTGTSDGFGAILDDVSLQPVPEPASMAALGIGLVGVIRMRRRSSS